jgi:hypothetical protein
MGSGDATFQAAMNDDNKSGDGLARGKLHTPYGLSTGSAGGVNTGGFPVGWPLSRR